eukprot:SAG11_NODE_16011_length_559_cov_1.158696_1_plen_28_part_01
MGVEDMTQSSEPFNRVFVLKCFVIRFYT